jgi:hypothetical protein
MRASCVLKKQETWYRYHVAGLVLSCSRTPVLKVHTNNQVLITLTILSDFQSLSTGTHVLYKRVMRGMKGANFEKGYWYFQCNAAKPRVMQKPTHALAKIATGRSSTAHA